MSNQPYIPRPPGTPQLPGERGRDRNDERDKPIPTPSVGVPFPDAVDADGTVTPIGGGGDEPFIGIMLQKTTNQSFPASPFNIAIFGTVVWQQGNISARAGGGGFDGINILEPGLYLIVGRARFNASTAEKDLTLNVNNPPLGTGTHTRISAVGPSTMDHGMEVSTVAKIDVGVGSEAVQLNCLVSASCTMTAGRQSALTVVRLGPLP